MAKKAKKSVEQHIADTLEAIDDIAAAVVESDKHDIAKFDALLGNARTNLNKALLLA